MTIKLTLPEEYTGDDRVDLPQKYWIPIFAKTENAVALFPDKYKLDENVVAWLLENEIDAHQHGGWINYPPHPLGQALDFYLRISDPIQANLTRLRWTQ